MIYLFEDNLLCFYMKIIYHINIILFIKLIKY